MHMYICALTLASVPDPSAFTDYMHTRNFARMVTFENAEANVTPHPQIIHAGIVRKRGRAWNGGYTSTSSLIQTYCFFWDGKLG